MPRRVFLPVLGLLCALVLSLFCYRKVLFEDEQFAYRDAAHFYYPLHLRIQQEWQAGRWPLWDPGQNGGSPLLGYPMAAVLYPGKILFALMPFPWASRFYVIVHTGVALAGVLALARALGITWVGASLGALGYAFGAPVLFQYSNVIYLVGAAWAPWGYLALEFWLRRRSHGGVAALAVVLALETLGGDPETAYLTMVCGGGYALLLARRPHPDPDRLPSRWRARSLWLVGIPAVLVLWVALVLGADILSPRIAWPRWLPSVAALQGAGWGVMLLALLLRWRHREAGAQLGPSLVGLAGAGVLAMALAGAQLLPSLEFSGLSDRAVEEQPLSVLDFSLEPYRLAELVWPCVFGTPAPENRYWLLAIPPSGQHQTWTLSIYIGGLTVALALAGAMERGGPAPRWRAGLAAVAAISLVASLGRHAGPLWWIRWFPDTAGLLGPHDPHDDYFRTDTFLEDGFASPYALLTMLLPGFSVFRYPSKLLTFTVLALAVLSGRGWDLLQASRTRWPARYCGWGLAVTLAALVCWTALPRTWIVAELNSLRLPDPGFGPLDIPAALDATRRALIHGAMALGLGLALVRLAPRRPRLAGALALITLSLDLGAANAGLIWTIPQADFDRPSVVARKIAAHERSDPSPGPFRVHRMPDWRPNDFAHSRSQERLRELIAWERDTLEPLFGLPLGLQYGLVKGNLEVLDYVLYYRQAMLPVHGPLASVLKLPEGAPVLFIPRRAFDLWNNRYFILPVYGGDWSSRERGYAALIHQAELIYPSRDQLAAQGPDAWREKADWMLLKNRTAFPRAWLVHHVRVRPPVSVRRLKDQPDDDRRALLHDLLYENDSLWSDPGRPVYNLHEMAFLETEKPTQLAGAFSRRAVTPTETVTITNYEPQRVELTAHLDHSGLVILADTFYPGWRLRIDGAAAPIYRTNHAMRGAAVKAGTHRLVYTYEPISFRAGLVLSGVGVAALAALMVWSAVRRSGPPPQA